MKMKNNKKGMMNPLEGMSSLIVPLVAIAIALVVGFLIITESREQVCSVEGLTGTCAANQTSVAVNATNDVVDAMNDIPGWLPIIVITVIGAILVALIGIFRGR